MSDVFSSFKVERERRKIFTVGNSGVGKSTFLGSLSFCIRVDSNIINPVELDNLEGYQMYMRDWVLRIEKNLLPPPTQAGKFNEIKITFGTTHDDLLPLTFYEMSGEDLSDFDVLTYAPGHLPDKYFAGPIEDALVEMNTIILVHPADASKSYDWDAYFEQFLAHMKEIRMAAGKYDPIPHMLVISKWDEAQEGETLKEFVKTRLPNTLGCLQDASVVADKKIFTFSVGEVVAGNDEEYVIKRFDPTDSKKILDWMYKFF